MTLYEYLALSEESQWDEIWDSGKRIDNYKSIDCKFTLYALDKFFVEVELCVSTDKILGKHPFKHGERMDRWHLYTLWDKKIKNLNKKTASTSK